MTRLQEDVKHMKFWRSLLAEFVGSAFVVLIGCGAWTQSLNQDHPDAVKIALAFGLTYAVVLYCFRPLGDCQISTAVTLALLATRKTSVVRAILCFVCQIFGAIFGACFVFGVTSYEQRNATAHRIGCTVPAEDVPESHAFGVEFFATFFFVFVVFACNEKRPADEGGIPEAVAPFLVGITYAAVSLFAIPYSGASMNPSRSFGPALIGGVWTKHWIYWFGPLLGGVLGGALYELIFSAKSSFARLKACFLVFHRGESSSTANRAAQNEIDGDGHEDLETGLKYHGQSYLPVATQPPKNGMGQIVPDKSQERHSYPPPIPSPPKISPTQSPTCVLATEIQTHFHEPSHSGLQDSTRNSVNEAAKDFQIIPLSSQTPCQCAVPY